jgi:Ca2+-binding RTX toxin-like protein
MTTTPTIWKSFTANIGSLPGGQLAATTMALADGGFLVTWGDDTKGSSPGLDIFAQKFDAEGNPRGGAFQLNTVSKSNDEYEAKLAALPDGGFVIVYGSFTEGQATFDNRDLIVERRNASGQVVFTQTLHDVPIAFGYDVAAAANGDYTVQFSQYFDSSLAIDSDLDAFGFIYDFETNERGERFSAGRNASEGELMESAAALAGGGFASVTTRFIGDIGFVVAKAVGGDGQTVMAPFTLGEGQNAEIAALANGNIAVVYQRGADIFYRVINPDGGASPELAAAATGNNEFIPAITHLLDGGFFIAWFDFDRLEIRGQRYNASGATVGGTVVAFSGLGQQAFIEIDASLTSDGRILLTFADGLTNIREVILDPRDAFIQGTSGNDVITTRLDSTLVFASPGNDKIFGQGGNDSIFGEQGNDVIQGGGGVDSIGGDEGNDTVVLLDNHNTDNIDGGPGQDRLDLQRVTNRGAVVDLGAGTWFMTTGFAEDSEGIIIGPPVKGQPPSFLPPPIFVRTIVGIESVFGTQKDDRVTGSSGQDTFYGFGGNDTLSGGDGIDKLVGQLGNDTLDGGAGNDRLYGDDGADTLIGGAGADKLDGGAGGDMASYRTALVAVSADLDGIAAGIGDALGDTYISIEHLEGSNLAGGVDRLRGNAGDNQIFGANGNDQIDGKAGNDVLVGGLGADTLRGSQGDDVFAYASAAEGGDTVLDFSSNAAGNNDGFAFSAAGFGAGLVAGVPLNANQFEANAAGVATLLTTRFVYDTDDEVLRFTANGSGGGAAAIATLQNGAALVIGDISVF